MKNDFFSKKYLQQKCLFKILNVTTYNKNNENVRTGERTWQEALSVKTDHKVCSGKILLRQTCKVKTKQRVSFMQRIKLLPTAI